MSDNKKKRFTKTVENCKHEHLYRNGHNRNGTQRWICKYCGTPILEMTNRELMIFNENIDLINYYKNKIIRKDYLYMYEGEYESEFATSYEIIPEKTINWNSFKKKINKLNLKEPILFYYMTPTVPYKMNSRNLHVGLVDASK